MKRHLAFCILFLMFASTMWAQDIIVTNDAQKIEAKILEVSKTEIKYKEKSDLNGPTYILGTKEISSIIYSNGKVVLYNQESATIDSTPDKQTEISPEQSKDSNATESAKSTYTPGRIYRDNGQYLHNDTYISAKEVERILERENPAAYKEWQKADGMSIAGGVFDGIGLGLAIGGLFTLLPQYRYYTACIGIECGALVSLSVGLGLTFGASAHYNKAIDIYNSKYDHAAVQLKWHVAPTEVGLALVF